MLYEGWPEVNPDAHALPPALEERLDALLAEDNRKAVLETFYREVVGMSAEELSGLWAIPGWWQARLAVAHTIPRELRADSAFDPEQAAAITVPVLMLIGGDSPDHLKADYETVAAALPDVRITVLEGQLHIAHLVVPETFARHLIAFLDEP